MLWSTTLTAGKPENVEAIFSLNITQATLGKANGERHFVKVTYLNPVTEENVTAVVAVLQTGQNENVALNLVFDQGETFTLSSTAQIFLTGYYVTDMDEDDEDDEDRFALPDDFDEDEDDEDLDEDLEDDEDDSDEEPKIKEIPVAAPPAKKQAVGQGNVPKAVPVKEAPKAAAAAPAAKAAPAPAAKAAPAPAAAPAAAAPAPGEGKKKKKKNKKNQEGEEAGLPSDILNSIAAKAPAAAAAPVKAAAPAKAAPAAAAAPAKAAPAKAAAPAAAPAKAAAPAATPVKAAPAKAEVAASPAKPAAPKTTTLPSGLVIQDVNVGKGDKADRGKKVFVNYIGKLESGRVFDKSARPFKFRLGVGEVIKGWDQGVVGMQVGGTRNLVIPASLAYGKAGAPPDIPPNATLHFSVELVRVERS